MLYKKNHSLWPTMCLGLGAVVVWLLRCIRVSEDFVWHPSIVQTLSVIELPLATFLLLGLSWVRVRVRVGVG